MRGPTSVCIFEGKMNAPLFINILTEPFCPFNIMIILMGVNLCRIMTPNTALDWSMHSMRGKALIVANS